MARRSLSPGELERAFARASQLRAEAERKERLASRRIVVLARGLADRVEPGMHLHRRGVGIHAFDADGVTCLAAAYLENQGDEYRYRYAVLYGGAGARRALRDAPLDPSDSDEPGSSRRVNLATYSDYVDFVDRLPIYISEVSRKLEERAARAEAAISSASKARRGLNSIRKAPARAALPRNPR